jgi:starvation-inducible DNA-binding protein
MKKKAAPKATASARTTESLDIGLDAKVRASSVKALSGILANQHVLYIKTRNFHWNLSGHRFHTIDKTAERIRMLGAASPGSMKEFLALASLKECTGALIGGDEAIVALRDDHEAAARELRKAVDTTDEAGDAGTADFLTELLQNHEEAAWMLRSFLE